MSDETPISKQPAGSDALRKAVSLTCHRLQENFFMPYGSPQNHLARAQLAELRKITSLNIMDNPLALEKVLFIMKGDFVEKLAGKTDEPSPSEQAAFVALTLFGWHMQSATKPMHTAEISFARACGKLFATGTSDSIKSRVDAMLLARDEKSRLLQIRSLVSLLRSKELPCDYGKLASDLRALMNPKRRPGVLLRWGRDFANGSFQTESTSKTTTDN